MKKPRKPLRRKTRLRPVSRKRAEINKIYLERRAAYLKLHPYCMVWLKERGLMECNVLPNGWVRLTPTAVASVPSSQDIHHTRGRGKYLLDESTWMAVSRNAHHYIHDYPGWAYEKGYLLPR